MQLIQVSSRSLARTARAAICSVLASPALLIAACSSNTAPPGAIERDGAQVPIGRGTAYAYVNDASSGASSIGVALTRSALDGLPAQDTVWTLPLPAGVTPAPFDHITLNWNAQGHPPGPYMLPHFDFHFYTISPSAQAAIGPGNDSTPVPAANVPRDYVSGVEVVPNMGVHWVDTTSAELHGATFDQTFIYGFYRGGLAFFEPMITRAFLASAPASTREIKLPQAFAQAGRFPKSYSVRSDPTTGTIRIALDSLVTR